MGDQPSAESSVRQENLKFGFAIFQEGREQVALRDDSNSVELAPVSRTTGMSKEERPSAASSKRSTTMDEAEGS